jgi:hypothetical protein
LDISILDDPDHRSALSRIFPLVPWAIARLQNEVPPLMFDDLDVRTRASMVYDLVTKEGKRRFHGDPLIQVTESKNLTYFVLPRLLLRVKHATKDGLRIATNATEQTSEWTYQQFVLPKFVDPRIHLHLVYVPDVFWTKIERCSVALYLGDSPREYRDIDVVGWGESVRGADIAVHPDAAVDHPLRLKPSVTTLPLRGSESKG